VGQRRVRLTVSIIDGYKHLLPETAPKSELLRCCAVCHCTTFGLFTCSCTWTSDETSDVLLDRCVHLAVRYSAAVSMDLAARYSTVTRFLILFGSDRYYKSSGEDAVRAENNYSDIPLG
jgi:hypothetical protein